MRKLVTYQSDEQEREQHHDDPAPEGEIVGHVNGNPARHYHV